MPVYVYRCDVCGAEFEIEHDVAGCDTAHPCLNCGIGQTHRVPQVVRWNWGGLPPHEHVDTHPEVADLLDERARDNRMAAYAEKKAERGETWP